MNIRCPMRVTPTPMRPTRVRPLRALFLLALVVPIVVASCRKPARKADDPEKEKRTCADQLEAGIEMAQPEKLGSSTNFSRTAERLNDWYRDCPEVKEIPATIGPVSEKLTAALFNEEEMKEFQDDSFDDQDVRHIRNSLFLSRIAVAAIPDPAASDLRQTVDVFAFVVRNIELVELSPKDTPRPLFHVLMLGRGTAEDRAWLFTALLRQLKIPSVILSSGKKKDAPADAAFVVGVPLNNEVYLFDTKLGLPIPAPDDDLSDPFIRKPATLKQFVENPAVVAGLNDGMHTYPLTADDLKEPRVGLAVHRSLLVPRMKRLQFLKDVKWRRSVMSDGLDNDKTTGPGLFERIVKAGAKHWKPESIEIWSYPTRLFRRYNNRTDEQRSQSTALMRSLAAPMNTSIDKQTKKVVIDGPSNLQLRSRIQQLQGALQQAVQNYVNVRLQCGGLSIEELRLFPEQNRLMMAQADEDASFWVGVCQFEQGDYRNCIDTLEEYRKSVTPRKWRKQAGYILAMAWMAQNKSATARGELNAIARDTPQSHGNYLLWKRWQKVNDRKTPAKSGN